MKLVLINLVIHFLSNILWSYKQLYTISNLNSSKIKENLNMLVRTSIYIFSSAYWKKRALLASAGGKKIPILHNLFALNDF